MRLVVLAACLSLAQAALACGVCVEDKVASCYDHGVITQALKSGREVAFFAAQGRALQGPAASARILKTMESTAGVRRGTARVSVENGAISFSYDPRRTNAVTVADALEKRIELNLGLLKVIDARNR